MDRSFIPAGSEPGSHVCVDGQLPREPLIYTENMTVGYDGKALIRDIRLSLEKGRILTLIGPNGAGKSTILKSLIRQLKLVEGAVFLDQKSMEKMTDKEISRKLAVVMTGRMQPEQIPGILAGCDRSQAGPTLPAKGLFLKCVEYPDMKENHS